MADREQDHDSPDLAADGSGGQVLDGWLTRQQLAKELGVAPKTLSRWASMGIGPVFVRVGTRALYRVGSVQDWLVKMEDLRRNRAARS